MPTRRRASNSACTCRIRKSSPRIEPGHTLLLDDGKVRLTVPRPIRSALRRASWSAASCPTARASACPIRDPVLGADRKDRSDLEAALETGIDWIALSFVQRPEDIAEAKKITRGRAAVMAKIEKPQAVARLAEIIELADALMVARGDLGVEMPLEKVPGLQKQMTRACRAAPASRWWSRRRCWNR